MAVPFMLLPAGLVVDGALDETRADQFEKSLIEFVEQHLRSSDVETLEEASVQLARELASAAGRSLEKVDPERFGRWTRLATRLAAGASGATEGGIRRFLKSYGGKPQQVLDALAGHPRGEEVAQRDLRERLGIEETYMSKIVARLAEADLVAHWKSGRTGYLVATAAGRRFAARRDGPEDATMAQILGQVAEALQELSDELEHSPRARMLLPASNMIARGLSDSLVLDADLASEFGYLLVTQAGRRHPIE